MSRRRALKFVNCSIACFWAALSFCDDVLHCICLARADSSMTPQQIRVKSNRNQTGEQHVLITIDRFCIVLVYLGVRFQLLQKFTLCCVFGKSSDAHQWRAWISCDRALENMTLMFCDSSLLKYNPQLYYYLVLLKDILAGQMLEAFSLKGISPITDRSVLKYRTNDIQAYRSSKLSSLYLHI